MNFVGIDGGLTYDNDRDVVRWRAVTDAGEKIPIRVSRECIDEITRDSVSNRVDWCRTNRPALERTAARKLKLGHTNELGGALITTRDAPMVLQEIARETAADPAVMPAISSTRPKRPIVADADPTPLQLSAWIVADDAQEAIARLRKREDVDPNGNWRVDFIAAVTILRSIGHALRNDGKSNPRARERMAILWPLIQRHPVFKVLERRRNAALKENLIDAKMFVTKTWSSAERMEDATDVEELGMLYLNDTSEPAVDEFFQAWDFWLSVIAGVMHNSFPAMLQEDQLDPPRQEGRRKSSAA